MTALRPVQMNVIGNKTFKLRTLSALIMGLCVGGQAFAETNNKNEANSEEGTISVVTVIGEKTERSIYDTGSSVEVYDEDRINTTPGATEIADLLQITPNIVDTGKGNSLPTIRGLDGSGPSVGGAASFAGTAPRLNLSIDGRSLTYSEIAFGPRSLWDMQQAEIYLGPQSYVQGQNASAGAIVMKSKDPTYHFESAVKGALAEQNYSQTAAMISAPILDDELAFRLSVDQQKRKSHLDLASYDPAGDSRRVETTTARGKFLFEPSALEGFKSTLAVTYMDTRAPQSENVVGPNYPAERPIYESNSVSTAWNVSWKLSDTTTIENNLVYAKFGYDRVTDPTGRRADFTTKGKEFHIEPLVKYHSLDDKIVALAGLRYFGSKQDDLFITTSETSMEGSTKTQSAFAEVTYSATEQVDVTFAGRFEKENKVRDVDLLSLDYDETATVFLPKFDVAYKPESTQTIGFKVAKGYNSGGAGLAFNPTRRVPMLPYSFKKEDMWNYEIYTRHLLQDSTVELTTNLFYNDFNNMQIQQSKPDGYVFVENVDGANSYGAEAGTRWLATTDLEVFANIGLLKTEYKETELQGGKTRELPRAPSLTGTFGALYTFGDGFELSGNANYTGSYFSDRENSAAQKIAPFWVSNAQLAYVFDGGRASLFVTNVLDSQKKTLVTYAPAVDEPLKQAPRQIGASIELHF
ncbi:TonB-dependent receptor plug domain-containing protein [Vibrio sp. S9_S30]|uniref:TonB-dependent receptor domain-containing protein n=1 Tax=Vibrio sp. S9_S30 TaxID=2720226 RepID=UPI001680BF3D|nr:TonB-dependent receptor [Vibrio sp. S9_S30]MBD1557635.1 TonB-dependent receptor plug domain-containing protein [Vibrio sp. S9_S30]